MSLYHRRLPSDLVSGDFTNSLRRQPGSRHPHANYNRLSIHVTSLDHLNELKGSISALGVELDMAKIESLKNFKAVANLTNTLSIVIIVVSIIAICTFMGYLLYVFLYKNRMHLGMLKAFGVPFENLRTLYTRKMVVWLLGYVVVAFGLSCLIGYSGILRSALALVAPLDPDYKYFDMGDYYPILFAGLVITLSYVSLRLTADQILKLNPGDLIYDRPGQDHA